MNYKNISPTKLAIIGLGRMGKHHYRLLQKMDNIKIVALCDVETESTFSYPLYHDVDEMLSCVDIEVAIITVPTSLHKEIALKCMEKNIHLFIEKPISSTVSEAKILLDKSRLKNIKVVVGYIERFNPVVQLLQEKLKNSQIYSIQTTRISPFPSRIVDVGVLTDLSVHDIDLITFISGKKIKHINIFKSKNRHQYYEDTALLSLQLEKGTIASITTSWLSPISKRVIHISSNKGYYEADLITQELFEFQDNQKRKVCFVEKRNPLKDELTAFIKYIQIGDNNMCATIEESMNTLKMVSAE